VSLFDEKAARLARLFTAICLGQFDVVRTLRREAPAGEPDRAWREAVLQTHLFSGFPRLVQAYGVLEEEGGLGDPEPDEYELEEGTGSRGEALFDAIYSSVAPKMRARLASFRPDFATWLMQHAYGNILSRPGLEPVTRELLSVCVLAAMDQPAQLESHARGALRFGASLGDLFEALDVAEALAPQAPIARAREAAAQWA